MGKTKSFTKNTFKRLHIDRKMIGILIVFTVLGIFLTISMVVATNSLSGLRGYASFQTNWTEARKEATFQLVNYVKTKEDHYLARFDSALHLIKSAEEIRHELSGDEADLNSVRELFLQTHSNPQDIDNMINTFVWFHSFPDFQNAIEEWIKSDEIIFEMETLAAEAEEFVQDDSFSESQQEQYVARILRLDRELTNTKHRLASALASGTHFVSSIMLWFAITLGFILLATGGMLSFRFLKSIKNWRREIEMSEQRYRSLYEQNPNAVFSVSQSGHFMDANSVFQKKIGYSLQELKEVTFDKFVKPSELETVREYFRNALEGTPQTYETKGVLKNGELFYVEVTNLPIFVDGEIIGVYGIAHDITYRKNAEQKIKEQLEEKTHLLSEIHDRVKNNMALISGLIQLQQEMSDSDQMENYFESTVSRIHSMALVHERLYHNETFSSIRMDEYVKELVESAQKKYCSKANELKVIVDTRPVTLSIKQSIPAGLLLNELLINAFKYGSIDGKGKVEVSLYQHENEVYMKVSDNGPGFPDDIEFENPKTLGMTLISSLIKQLKATHQLASEDGISFSVSFKSHAKISKTA